jgi:hypothetical protein
MRQVDSQYDQKDSSTSPPTSAATSLQEEYVNTGYERWVQTRNTWRTAVASVAPARTSRPIDLDEIADRLSRPSSGFVYLPYPVPLGQMIEVLIEQWEADGLGGLYG